MGTPVQRSPSRLHPVTQWMSAITSFEGSARSSPYSSDRPFSTAPKTLKSHFAMSVLGTGPKWRSGQRSGAVSVWPGGMRAGSTPSGMRLLLKSEATSGEYRKRRVYSHFSALRELCGPVAQLGARLNRTQEVRGSNPLGSTNCPFMHDADSHNADSHHAGLETLGSPRPAVCRRNRSRVFAGPGGFLVAL